MSPLYFSLSLSNSIFYEVESIYFINNNNGNSFRCRRFRCNIFNSKLSHLNFSKFQVLPFFVSCLSRERKREIEIEMKYKDGIEFGKKFIYLLLLLLLL